MVVFGVPKCPQGGAAIHLQFHCEPPGGDRGSLSVTMCSYGVFKMPNRHYLCEPIGGAPHRPVGFFGGPGGIGGPQMSPWGSWGAALHLQFHCEPPGGAHRSLSVLMCSYGVFQVPKRHYLWEPIGGDPYRPVGFLGGGGGLGFFLGGSRGSLGSPNVPMGVLGGLRSTCNFAVSHRGALAGLLVSQCVPMGSSRCPTAITFVSP